MTASWRTRFGVAAVDLIADRRVRQDGLPAAGVDPRRHHPDAVGKMKMVDPNGEIIRAARAIGIGFGD